MKIIFLTGNKYKFKAAADILKSYDIKLIQEKDITPIEIQSLKVADVASFAAAHHSKNAKIPVIKVDCGLYIKELNGFPGTYTADINKTIGYKGILKLLENAPNRLAVWKDALAYATPEGLVKVFESETAFEITKEPYGEGTWSFDSIMRPIENNEANKTFAEMTTEERLRSWNTTIFKQLGEFLTKHKRH